MPASMESTVGASASELSPLDSLGNDGCWGEGVAEGEFRFTRLGSGDVIDGGEELALEGWRLERIERLK